MSRTAVRAATIAARICMCRVPCARTIPRGWPRIAQYLEAMGSEVTLLGYSAVAAPGRFRDQFSPRPPFSSRRTTASKGLAPHCSRLRDFLRLAHHAKDVPAGDLRDLLVLVAAPEQFGDQRRIGRDVLQARGRRCRCRRSRRRGRCDRCRRPGGCDRCGRRPARAWRAARDAPPSTPSTPSVTAAASAGKLLRQPRLAQRSGACSRRRPRATRSRARRSP